MPRAYAELLPDCTCDSESHQCQVHGTTARANAKRAAQRAVKDGRLTQEEYDNWIAKYPRPRIKKKWTERWN